MYMSVHVSEPILIVLGRANSYMLAHSPVHQQEGVTQHAYIMVVQYEAVIRPFHQSYTLLSEINQHPSSHSESSIHGGHDMKV